MKNYPACKVLTICSCYNRCSFTLFQQVADAIGADPREIIFTSGATESNNIAVKGTARFYKSKKKHVITTQTVCTDNSSGDKNSTLPLTIMSEI